jgi:hypothetical protein
MTAMEPNDMIEQVRRDLQTADVEGDEARLKTLDDLYASLSSELERDLDQAGTARF